jgi:signal transduction histidine kinase
LERATIEGTDDRVLAGRIDSLIGQQPVALAANVILAGLLAPALNGAVPGPWLAAWVATVWGITAWRGAIWLRHRGQPVAPADAKAVARAMTAVAVITGAAWGVPGGLFFPADPGVLQGFLVFLLGGLSAAAVATLAGHLPAFRYYVVLVLVPMIGRLLYEGDFLSVVMGSMSAIYFVVLMFTGNNLNRTLTRALTLQIEKSDLAEDLAEARIQAEAANTAKAIFLATVSHELRTPLNAVLGFTHLVRDEVHGPLGSDTYKEYLDHVNGSGQHLLHLIDELLDLSRAEAGYLVVREESVIDLGSEMTHCLAFLAARAEHGGVTLRAQGIDRLPALRADPRRLRQIVLNVLSNAVKFTPRGGEATVTAERASDGSLVLAVRDTGIGMSEEDLSVALENFGRTDSSRALAREGAGIGLPLTGLLMELHGGGMKIASDPGGGTLVSLRFPAERVIESAGSARSGGTSAHARGQRASPSA